MHSSPSMRQQPPSGISWTKPLSPLFTRGMKDFFFLMHCLSWPSQNTSRARRAVSRLTSRWVLNSSSHSNWVQLRPSQITLNMIKLIIQTTSQTLCLMALLFLYQPEQLQVGNKHKSDEIYSGRGNSSIRTKFQAPCFKECCVQCSWFNIKKILLFSQVKSRI